jgi:hypothetical protein
MVFVFFSGGGGIARVGQAAQKLHGKKTRFLILNFSGRCAVSAASNVHALAFETGNADDGN